MKLDLDIRDIAIIDALPVHKAENMILNVGCGKGRIDRWLSGNGYTVYAVDTVKQAEWENSGSLLFFEADVFYPDTMPVKSAPVVLCSEVLEHLTEWKKALKNLLELAEHRLIITVPHRKSFGDSRPPPLGHCNFWDDVPDNDFFLDINEFHELCYPYSVAISKIRTKPKDVELRQRSYLIVVDKKQRYGAHRR